jgi:protein-disulfide isomerase
MTTTIEQCKHNLTENEKKARGDSLARKLAEIDSITEQRKEVAAKLKSQIDGIKLEIKQLGHTLLTGYEYRDTECVVIMDYKRNVVEVSRLDTGEIIRSRTMTVPERQRDFEELEKEMEPETEPRKKSKTHKPQ